MERNNPQRHHHTHHILPRVLFYAHIAYYGATAIGLHSIHAYAAGSVLILLIAGAALGVAE